MFWKTQLDEATGIAHILNKEDVTLKEILDDPYVLQELKCGNQRLIDYVKKAEILMELTKLSLSEPTETTEPNAKRYKYFHLSSEVLCADSEEVTSALSQEAQCFQCLADFVKPKETLNPLLASSFAKIFSILAQRFPASVLNFMKCNPQFLDDCSFHLETYAVADALFRLCACVESEEEALKIRTWLCEMDFCGKLASKFVGECNEETHVNAAYLITELIKCLRDLSYSKDDKTLDPLLEQLQSKKFLSALLDRMFALPYNSSVLVNGCNIFLTLLQTLPSSFNLSEWNYSKTIEEARQMENNLQQRSLQQPQGPQQEWSPDPDGVAVDGLCDRLGDFMNVISQNSPISSSSFGAARLASLKLVTQLATLNSPRVHSRLCDVNAPGVLFDCFFAYSRNNFLHCCVYEFVYFVLNLKLNENNDDASIIISPLLKQVFNDGKILTILLDNLKKTFAVKPSYYGHLMKMAESLHRATSAGYNANFINETLKELSQLEQDWTQFVKTTLEPYVKLNEPDPVGLVPSSTLDVLREDFPPVVASSAAFHRNQLFAEYQSQQITEQFPEPTGFPPDTFTAEHRENINDTLAKTTDISIKMDGKEKLNLPGESEFESLCNRTVNRMDADDDFWPEREITFTSSSLLTNPAAEDSKLPSFVNKRRSSSSSSDEDPVKMDLDRGPDEWPEESPRNQQATENNWAHFD